MGTKFLLRLLFTTFLICQGTVALADIERRMTLTEKVAAADTIVHARCVQTSTEWRNGLVVTTADYVVLDDLRGKGSQSLRLTVPGGTAVHPTLGIPMTTMLSNGVEVRVDDEAILFSVKTAQGENRLIAGEQAYVRLSDDAIGAKQVRTDERRLVAIRSTEAGPQTTVSDSTDISSEPYSVEDYKQIIRTAISRQGPAVEEQ